MIDTFNWTLDRAYYDHDHIQQIFDSALDFKSASRFKNGSSTTVGYRNYKFTLTEKCLKAQGSLTKLYIGNNIENINFRQVQQALTEFETLFGVPFDEAKIKRIDVAANIQLVNLPAMYLDILIPPATYKTTTYNGECKYFESSKNKLTFYDKVAEVKKKDRGSYFGNKDKNILKYEVSLTKNIAKNLALDDFTFKNLYDPLVYLRLLKKWLDCYYMVPKLTNMLPSQLNFSSLNSIKESLAGEGIRALGGIQVMEMLINQAKIDKAVKHRFRKYLTDFTNVEPLSPVLQDELTGKVENMYTEQLSYIK